jgi:hypothetical protein
MSRGTSQCGSVTAVWGTVLFVAFIAALDPVRVAIALLLISWPRPMRNLLAYWLGAMAASLASAVAALTLLRHLTPILTRNVVAMSGSNLVHILQMCAGLIALPLAAWIIVTSMRQRSRMKVTAEGPAIDSVAPIPPPPTLPWLSARTQNSLRPRSFRVVFFGGFISATPPVEYLVILAAILASGAATGVQLSAAMTFTLVSLVVIEIPLITCLAAPGRSHSVMLQVHNWVHARHRVLIAIGLAIGGVAMLATGMGNA